MPLSGTANDRNWDDDQDQPITNVLARELHQAAQPLTVLQGLLELSLLNGRSVEDFRGSLEAAMEQLQRAMQCFDRARETVLRAQSAALPIPGDERKIQHV